MADRGANRIINIAEKEGTQIEDLELEATPKQHATSPEGEFTGNGSYCAPAVDIYDTPYESVILADIDNNVLIGYAVSPEESYCANIPFDEFIAICNSQYFQVNTARIFYGLKRIWEFLDERGCTVGMLVLARRHLAAL